MECYWGEIFGGPVSPNFSSFSYIMGCCNFRKALSDLLLTWGIMNPFQINLQSVLALYIKPAFLLLVLTVYIKHIAHHSVLTDELSIFIWIVMYFPSDDTFQYFSKTEVVFNNNVLFSCLFPDIVDTLCAVALFF